MIWKSRLLGDSSATNVPASHTLVLSIGLALVPIGCCEAKEKPRTYELERGVDEDCPSARVAASELEKLYGSSFGSVDGPATSSIRPAWQRCCYDVSYTLNQQSMQSEECLEFEASDGDPTTLPSCPAGQAAVTALEADMLIGKRTNKGPPDLSDVAVLSGPTMDLMRPAVKVCSYPGTELDSTDVCG
ncbi:MAG: hypothetical protein R3B13_16315 [Polyangiaceae bacterium]